MSTKSDNNDKPRTDIFELLPEVFRSDLNETLFEASFNRHLTKDDTVRVSGFIGQGNPAALVDRQIQEPTPYRQAFQLQPVMYTRVGSVDHVLTQQGFLKQLELMGVNINRLPEWGNTLLFNWVPPINVDMLVNYFDYYWKSDASNDLPQYFTIENRCNKAQSKASSYENTINQYGPLHSILEIDIEVNTFVVEDDMSDIFVDGFVFFTKNTLDANLANRFWTTASSTYDVGTNKLTITVQEDIALVSTTPPLSNPIVGVNATLESFTLAGDLTAAFVTGVAFSVSDSTGNDGNYTVASSTFGVATTIFTVENVVSPIPDGLITIPSSIQTGRLWYKPDTDEIFRWSGATWIPIPATSVIATGDVSLEELLTVFQRDANCICHEDFGWDLGLWDDNQLGTILWNTALLAAISYPTEATWVAANGVPANLDLWYDTTNDQLKQFFGGVWNVSISGFSTALTLTTGRARWDNTVDCVAQELNQWSAQNKWIHKTEVQAIGTIKRAQLPIIEYNSTIELNQWTRANYEWLYRPLALDVFESLGQDACAEGPWRFELEPIKGYAAALISGKWYVYMFEREDATLNRDINHTDAFTPGSTFRIVDDGFLTQIYTVVSSEYRKITNGDPVNLVLFPPLPVITTYYVTVVEIEEPVFAAPLVGGGASNVRIEPTKTSQGDAWRGYHVHWLLDTETTTTSATSAQPLNPELELSLKESSDGVNPTYNVTAATASSVPVGSGLLEIGRALCVFTPNVAGVTTISLVFQEAAFAYQDVDLISSIVPGSPTGLTNLATAIYTATVTIDGIPYAISVQGNNAQTYATLATEIEADLASGTAGSVVITGVGGGSTLRVLSVTKGQSASVSIVDGNLFTSLTAINPSNTFDPAVAGVGEYTSVAPSPPLQFTDAFDLRYVATESRFYATPNSADLRVFIDDVQQYGNYIENVKQGVPNYTVVGSNTTTVPTIPYVESITFDQPLTPFVNVRIEVCPAALPDVGMFAVPVRTVEDDVEFAAAVIAGTQPVYRSLSQYHSLAQTKIETNQYPLFNVYDVCPDLACENAVVKASPLFAYKEEASCPINPNVRRRIFATSDGRDYTFIQYLLDRDDNILYGYRNLDLAPAVGTFWYNPTIQAVYHWNGFTWSDSIFIGTSTLPSPAAASPSVLRTFTVSATEPTELLDIEKAYWMDSVNEKLFVRDIISVQWVEELNVIIEGADPTLETVWKNGDNHEYVPQYVNADREPVPVGDPTGDWELLSQWFYNSEHKNKAESKYTQLVTHFRSISTEQPDVPGLLQGGVYTLTQNEFDYGLGGTMKEHNDSFDTLISAVNVTNTTPVALMEWSEDQYVLGLLLTRDFFNTDITRLYGTYTRSSLANQAQFFADDVIQQYKLNDYLSSVYGDTTAFDEATDIGMPNWIATAPILRLSAAYRPYLTLTDEFTELYHHDGHRSRIAYTPGEEDRYSRQIIAVPDDRVTNGTLGILSAVAPPATEVDFTTSFGGSEVRTGVYWYRVGGGFRTLYRFIPYEVTAFVPSFYLDGVELPDGTRYYNTLVDTTFIKSGLAWVVETVGGDVSTLWQEVDFTLDLAAIALDIETRLFEAVPAEPLVFDYSSLTPNASEQEEYDTLYERRFFAFVAERSIQAPLVNTTYTATNAFTWNYVNGIVTTPPRIDITPASAAAWQEMYTRWYGTPYPHLEPWRLQGYSDKPTWWDEEYRDPTGARRWIYVHGTTTGMWENIRVGAIPVGKDLPDSNGVGTGTAGDVPYTFDYFSVNIDDAPVAGYAPDAVFPPYFNLTLSPDPLRVRSLFSNLITELSALDADYVFGDVGPSEWFWTTSSEYVYDTPIIAFQMQPVRFLHAAFGINFVDVNSLQIETTFCQVYSHEDALFHSDIYDADKVYSANGLNQSYVNFNRASGYDTSNEFRYLWAGWNPRQAYQFAGIIDTSTFGISARYFDVIEEDYDIVLANTGVFRDMWAEGFEVSVLNIPPAIIQFNNQASWRFDLDTLATIDRSIGYYGVRLYPYAITPFASGYQTVSVTPVTLGSFASAIGADTYDFDVTVDGGSLQQLSIVLAGGEIYSTIAALMDTQVVGGTVTYDTPTSAFIVTSNALGEPTSVLVGSGTAGSPGGDLFAALEVADTVTIVFNSPINQTNEGTFFLYDIVDASAPSKRFFVPGNQTDVFLQNAQFDVSNSSLNNGTYTVVSSVYEPAVNRTRINVVEIVPSSVGDGQIDAPGFVSPWVTGQQVVASSSRNLPSPLVNGAPYFIISTGPRTFKLAETFNNALAGIEIDITTPGDGELRLGEILATFMVFGGGGNSREIWYHYALDKNRIIPITPPSVVQGMQALINIFDGYAEFQRDQGQIFNASTTPDFDEETGRAIDWQFEIERFIDWAYGLRRTRMAVADRYEIELNASPPTQELKFSSSAPVWQNGTPIIFGTTGSLPSPLLANVPYYFVQTEIPGVFRVSITSNATLEANWLTFTTTGSGTMVVSQHRAQTAFPSLEVNPIRHNIWYDTPLGVMANVVTGPYTDIRVTQTIFDQHGNQLTPDKINIYRLDKQARIAIRSDLDDPLSVIPQILRTDLDTLHLGGGHFFMEGYEHVIMFNDYGVNGALIYDQFYGLYTGKFELDYFEKEDYTLRPTMGGYYLIDGQFNRNIEGSTVDLHNYYDTYNLREATLPARYARHILGYPGTVEYLDLVNLNNKSQFLFYQGMIQYKGSVAGAKAYINSRRFIDAKIDEFWAWKIAEYGSPLPRVYPQIKLFSGDARQQDVRLHFLANTELASDADVQEAIESDFIPVDFAVADRWEIYPEQKSDIVSSLFLDAEVSSLYRVYVGTVTPTAGQDTVDYWYDPGGPEFKTWDGTTWNVVTDVPLEVTTIGSTTYVRLTPIFDTARVVQRKLSIPGDLREYETLIYAEGGGIVEFDKVNSEVIKFQTAGFADVMIMATINPGFSKISPSKLIDKKSNTVVDNVQLWDPARDHHSTVAIHNVDLQNATDPAGYRVTKNPDDIADFVWGTEQLGTVWLDTTQLGYKSYYDDKLYPNVNDRLNMWGSLADWSTVRVYEWTGSSVPPANYVDLVTGQASSTDLRPQRDKATGQAVQTLFRRDRTSSDASIDGLASGKKEVNFGLSIANTAAATSLAVGTQGYQDVNFTTDVVSGAATGLTGTGPFQANIFIDGFSYVINVTATAAPTYGDLIIQLNNQLLGTATASVLSVAGYQNVVVSPATLGAFASSIAGATYDFDVTIDGGGLQQLSIILTGGETYNAIAALMSTAVAGGSVTYDDTLSAFVVTSTATGVTSSVLVAPGTAGSGDLFAALTSADGVTFAFSTPTLGTSTIRITSNTIGLGSTVIILDINLFSNLADAPTFIPAGVDGVSKTYTATITIDDTDYGISVLGDDAQDFDDLLTLINAQINGVGFITLEPITFGNLVITSASVGTDSTVSFTEGTLFPALTGYIDDVSPIAPVDGAYGKVKVPTGLFPLETFVLFTTTDTLPEGLESGVSYFIVDVDNTTYPGTFDLLEITDSGLEEPTILVDISSNGVGDLSAVPAFTNDWVRDPFIRERIYGGINIVPGSFEPTLTLTPSVGWAELDNVDVYVNDVIQVNGYFLTSTLTIDLTDTDITIAEKDIIDVVRPLRALSEEEEAFNPDAEDDGTVNTQWLYDYEYSTFTTYSGSISSVPTQTYYFWVENSQFRNSTEQAGISAQEVAQQLTDIPTPYFVVQLPKDDPYLQAKYGYGMIPYGSTWSLADLAEQFLIIPVFYRQAVLRRASSSIAQDDRFVWKFTRDLSLRNSLKNSLNLKNKHEEWFMFRREQPSNLPRELWDRLTEAVVGYTLADSSVRVPTLDRELYDALYGTDTRFGLGVDQAFCDKTYALTSIIAYLTNPDIDFSPVDINAFFMTFSFDTPENIQAAMNEIYNTFGSTNVNNIWFETLSDAFATRAKYRELLKTSWIALHGIRVLEVGGLFDD